MAVYTLETPYGAYLTSAVASYDTVPASTKARYHLIDLENLGRKKAHAWVWACDSGVTPSLTTLGVDLRDDLSALLLPPRPHSSRSQDALAMRYPLEQGGGVNLATVPKLVKASG